jgi:hypothetical protein
MCDDKFLMQATASLRGNAGRICSHLHRANMAPKPYYEVSYE